MDWREPTEAVDIGDMSIGNGWFQMADAEHGPRAMVVAEIGVNHDGDAAVAQRLIAHAAAAGADAVKFQLFHPDRLLSNAGLLARYQHGKADDARALLLNLVLDLDTMAMLRDAAHDHGLRFVLTPFSEDDVEDLKSLDVDAVKIASPDAVNKPMLRAAAALGLPILISTGTCDLEELGTATESVRELETESNPVGGALLHCVSSYPTPRESAALGGIRAMREALAVPVGYSDHTPSPDTGALAVMAGAVVLEKHLTHDQAAPGPDHAASLPPDGFASYVRKVREAETMHGPIVKQVLDIERDVRKVSRQSVCASRNLPAGHVLTRADLTWKRPGTGIPAAELDRVIGRPLRRAVAVNDLLTWEDLYRA